MLLWSGAAQELSHTSPPLSSSFSHHHSSSSMRSTLSSSLRAFRSLSFYSHTHHTHHHHHQKTLRVLPLFFSHSSPLLSFSPISTPSSSSSAAASTPFTQPLEIWELNEEENFHFDVDVDEAANDSKNFRTPTVIEVKELDEFPEQWRRSKIAWLCKELPAHKPGTLIRLLNAQRKWMNLDNAMYIAVHFMRVRENETAFRVYKWMQQRHWFRFDFDFATRLADYMGKERKLSRCREIFDDIINQGRVPSESTFHILIVAYLSSPAEGYVEEACSIYNRMIQFGGYQPRLSLHNSLFRALVSKPGGSSKYFLKQVEFIFHNLVTTGLEIHKDIYAGMIWLHSYQDKIDTERLTALREEMQQVGIEEGRDVLVSILRAYSKEGDVEEVDRTWIKLLNSDSSPPSQAFVYRMEVYAKVNESLKSLSIFREMLDMGSTSVVAYHKIIEVMTKAQKVEIAETLMEEFMKSSLKPLMPSFVDLMTMFSGLSLHDKLEATFFKCLENCRPNRTIYNIYLDSLIKTGSHGKASDIFNQMLSNGAIGVNSRSCNTILRGYLDTENFIEAGKIYDLMCQKKYDIEPLLMEKLDYVLSLTRKAIKKPVSLKLSKEQREILIGLLLGGLQIQSDEERKNHAIHFEFNETSCVHAVLKRHIHDQYHEWLTSFSRPSDVDEEIPHRFSTIAHPCFDFYADQFWPKGRPGIPNLIHRWLSPRVLAYWYMYGGHKTPSGNILLKLKGGDREDVEKIVKMLKAKSLDCRVKRKGRVFWIGFLRSNSVWFWKLVEVEILEDLRDLLRITARVSEKEVSDDQHIDFECESDSDDNSGW